MEIQEQPAVTTKPEPIKAGSGIMVLVIIVSLIFGAVGGAGGAWYVFKNPDIQKKIAGSSVMGQSVSLSEDSAVIDVVKKASPAVVSIVISQDVSKLPGYGSPFDDPFFNFFGSSRQNQSTQPNIQEVGAGSGFFVSSDGLIFTNKHVVDNQQASYTVITQDGTKYTAQVLTRDPVNDLALLKIDIKNAPALDLSDSASLEVGQRVIAIGNSLGEYQNTVTTGIISGIGRKIVAGDQTGSEQLSGVLQTDAAINPGNSGGPLLNVLGQVVGINTAIDQQGQLVGFAIPSNELRKDMESFQKNGKITRPYLGVRYVIITSDVAKEQDLPRDYGALLLRGQSMSDLAVVPGSPADKAGLSENDIILEVNGKKVDENNTLSDALSDYKVGDSVKLKVYSKGNEKEVTVTLGETK